MTDPSSSVKLKRQRTDPPQAIDDILKRVCEIVALGISAKATASRDPWVLCIDDDREFATVMKKRLEASGISVINAYDGIEGVEKAFSHTADAIILDFNMPNGCGDQVLRRLRDTPMTREIPVIVLTGNKNEAMHQSMRDAGANALFTKPPVFSELLSELDRYIGGEGSNA